MKKIKTAVVGVGALGRHHLRWYSKIAESELVGLYDIDPERAKQYSEEYKITAFESLDDLCKSAEAVSIVTPTTTHCEIASTLIKKGIHCLIEKPIAANNEEATEIQNLADSHQVKVTVGHIERFNPAVQALQEFDIQPSFIEAHRLAAFDPRGTDVAVVLDLMIHDVDLVLKFIKSELTDIQASAVAVISEQADIANARLTFKNGAVANLTASRISLSAMRKIRIFQKSGYCSLDLARKQADFYSLADGKNDRSGARIPLGKSGKEIIYLKKPDTGKDMLESELSSFLKAIIDDRPVAVTVGEGARSLEVALEIKRIGYESIQRMLEN
ncbi:MAG: Gfo/Idh/MocA family oxidoreductase [candidate division Zixibacteria bacterium]|nr:Gfo/Idh/MocA family oxidoreductase [candidate division Zixibacteria bacterium]